jgi:PhzF family phenazine biosynthesis protein
MTVGVPFFFVDVFASRPLSGNPLSLVPDADHLGEPHLRAIAREFNQSETTFLVRPAAGCGLNVENLTRCPLRGRRVDVVGLVFRKDS